jgi:hypothetical protein
MDVSETRMELALNQTMPTCRYVTSVNDKLGPLQRLIPPVPPITRYKKVRWVRR